jgi:hypothetical protein
VERNEMPKNEPNLVLLAQLITLALNAQQIIKVRTGRGSGGNGEQRSTAGGRTPLRLAPFLRGEVPWAGWGCLHVQPGTVGCHPLVVSTTFLPSFLPYSCVGIGLT